MARKQYAPLGELWKGESSMIRWLAQNSNVLSEATGLSLSDMRHERGVGGFRVDLLARDSCARPVVTECQFGYSDHDHLGKLLTYLAEAGAGAGIWVTEHVCPEHIGAVSLLNALPKVTFYLVQATAVQTRSSGLKPEFRLVVGPQGVSAPAGMPPPRKEGRDRHVRKKLFWQGLLREAARRTPAFAQKGPVTTCELAASAGLLGVEWVYVINKQKAGVYLRLSRSRMSEAHRSSLLRSLERKRNAIAAAMGPEFGVRPGRNENTLAGSNIATGGYQDDEASWPALQREMAEAMAKLQAAIRTHIAMLRV